MFLRKGKRSRGSDEPASGLTGRLQRRESDLIGSGWEDESKHGRRTYSENSDQKRLTHPLQVTERRGSGGGRGVIGSKT